MGLWGKPTVTFSEEVKVALARAHGEATRRRNAEVTPGHLLFSLLHAPSVEACLAAMSVDPAAAREALGRELARLPRVGWLSFRPAASSAEYEKTLTTAVAKVMAAARAEVTGPLLAVYVLAQHDALVPPLAAVGFMLLAFSRAVAHGDTTPPSPPAEGLVSVVLCNDPFSTMELVVDTLREVFGITNEGEAVELMMRVHRVGRAVVGTMDAAVARRKIEEVHARAAAAEMPLRAIAEPLV